MHAAHIIMKQLITSVNTGEYLQMQELTEIILSRLSDLNILNQSESNSSSNYFNLILEQRNGQQSRTKKQAIILAHASSTGFECQIDQIYNIVLRICNLFDPQIYEQFKNYPHSRAMDAMYRLLRALFYAHQYKQKIRHLKYVFNKTYSSFLPYLVLALLSEWSKKQYAMKLRQFLIEQEQPQQQLLQSITQINQSVSKFEPQIIKSPLKSLQTPNENQQYQAKINNPQNQGHTRASSQQSAGLVLKTVNSAKILTIYSRTTFYSYITRELQQLYQLSGLAQLDFDYLKLLPKKKSNGNLAYAENINRAAEVLIQSGMNKQIRNSIKQYAGLYQSYAKGLKRNKIAKGNKVHHSVRSMSDHIASSDNKIKKSREVLKKFSYGVCHTEANQLPVWETQFSSLNSRSKDRLPQIVVNKQNNDQFYEDVKMKIKCELLKKLHNGKFPMLSQSSQKNGKSFQQFQFKSNLFRFQTQQPVIENQQSIEKIRSGFKTPGKTLKGIIVKNFISNREKSPQKSNKQTEKAKKHLQLDFKLNSKDKEQSPLMMDIKSLRQKTKAILKNFKLVQNY